MRSNCAARFSWLEIAQEMAWALSSLLKKNLFTYETFKYFKQRQSNFRVRISSWISSWIFELGFRFGFSSEDVELLLFFEMVTSNPAATNRLVCP